MCLTLSRAKKEVVKSQSNANMFLPPLHEMAGFVWRCFEFFSGTRNDCALTMWELFESVDSFLFVIQLLSNGLYIPRRHLSFGISPCSCLVQSFCQCVETMVGLHGWKYAVLRKYITLVKVRFFFWKQPFFCKKTQIQ